MVGGTRLPPQDSESEPGCYERKTRATARTKAKTLYEGKRQKPSHVYVSLDNADTVIEGAPPLSPSFGDRVGTRLSCCRDAVGLCAFAVSGRFLRPPRGTAASPRRTDLALVLCPCR